MRSASDEPAMMRSPGAGSAASPYARPRPRVNGTRSVNSARCSERISCPSTTGTRPQPVNDMCVRLWCAAQRSFQAPKQRWTALALGGHLLQDSHRISDRRKPLERKLGDTWRHVVGTKPPDQKWLRL